MPVRQRKETDPLPPLHRVQGLAPSDHKAMKGYREGVRVETPEAPRSQVAVEGEGHESGFEVPEGYQGGVH